MTNNKQQTTIKNNKHKNANTKIRNNKTTYIRKTRGKKQGQIKGNKQTIKI